MLPCVECGEGIPNLLSEQQIVRHITALLEDIDKSTAKRFMDVFDLRNDTNDYDFSIDLSGTAVVICSHCTTMHYLEWLSTYELPLSFWMGVMALPSISQPFVLQVRQFADARMFSKVHKLAMQKIRAEADGASTLPHAHQGRLIA